MAGKKIIVSCGDMASSEGMATICIYGHDSSRFVMAGDLTKGTCTLKVPALHVQGWHKIKVLTRRGWSPYRYFYYYQGMPRWLYCQGA